MQMYLTEEQACRSHSNSNNKTPFFSKKKKRINYNQEIRRKKIQSFLVYSAVPTKASSIRSSSIAEGEGFQTVEEEEEGVGGAELDDGCASFDSEKFTAEATAAVVVDESTIDLKRLEDSGEKPELCKRR